jgi:hypothetical protein
LAPFLEISWPIGLPVCFCTNNMLFLLLWLCSIVWSQVLWYLQHWTFCTKLLGYSMSFVLTYALHDFLKFLCRMSLDFW